jgi:hypothetical protein
LGQNQIIMSSKTILTVGAIIVLLGGYYFFTREVDESNSNENTELPVTLEDKKKQIIANYLGKYPINTEVDGDFKYTYEFEDQVIKPGKPIIFSGVADDIYREDGEMRIRFAPTFLDSILGTSQYYTLRGCEDRIGEITARAKTSDNPFETGEYVVVANIESVKKPILSIDASPISSDEVELRYETSETFLARGECLDLTYIADE